MISDHLTPLRLSLLAFGLAVCYFLASAFYNLSLSPLRKYPGPKLWAISQVPFSRAWISGHGHKAILELHQRYGDVVRVTPNQLSFGYPEAWEEIMGHRRDGQEENGKDPAFWIGNDTLTMVGSNRERHARLRKVLSNGFSAQALQQQGPIFDKYADMFVSGLRSACADGNKPVEMTSWFNWATFDVGGDLIFGEPFGCLENAHYHPWVRLFVSHLQGMAFSTAVVRFPFHQLLLKLITPKKIVEEIKMHREYVAEHVDKRRAYTTPRVDFMEHMIRAHEKNIVSYEEMTANAHNIIVGAAETTGTTMSGAIYLLAINPLIVRKLHDELTKTFSSEQDMNIVSVQKLDYMLAVIHESLRIFPPVPSAIPRKTPPSGSIIGGNFVPPNTILGIWQWPMFHNPKFFKDPEVFAPERWMGDEKYSEDRMSACQPFSVGPRNCIGKNLAYAEMRLFIARLIWNFAIELDSRSQGWLDRNLMYFLWQKPELYVRLIPRETPLSS